MKYLKILLLLCISMRSFAQDGYPNQLKICPTDTSENVVKMMIRDITQYTAKDYELVFVDSQRSKTYVYMYRSPQQEVLKISYKYTEGDNGKVVNYMNIIGEVGIMTGVYNYIFQTDLTPQDIPGNTSIGSSLEYGGKNHHFIFEADDSRPGYWSITFIN